MNFYKHYLGDFQRDTSHLSLTERGAYLALLHHYYATEHALPYEHAALCRIAGAFSKPERDAVKAVAGAFFELRDGYLWHKRVEAELEKQEGRCDKNREIALAREARKRAENEARILAEQTTERARNVVDSSQERVTKTAPPQSHSQILLNTLPPDGGCPIDPLGQSDPERPELVEKPAKPFPDCPYSRLLSLWAKHLPHLSQPRVWEGNRKATMRSRWQQAAKPSAYSPQGYTTEAEGIAWWDGFFAYIANDSKLSDGFVTDGRTWKPDLEWVCNAANFQKIIDGKYTK